MQIQEALDILSVQDSIIPTELHKIVQEMDGNRMCASTFLAKYCKSTEDEELLEFSKEEAWLRLTNAMTEDEELRKQFFQMLMNNEFVPGGRISASIGMDNNTSAFNCYVLVPPEDDLDSIFDCLQRMAKTYARGGGTGVDLSKLRPNNVEVSNAAKSSTGPVSFMDLFSKTTNTIGQNQRRGALMLSLSVEHPDILDFIKIKQYSNSHIEDCVIRYVRGETSLSELKAEMQIMYQVNHANISVRLTDKFMQAVAKNKDFELKWEGKVKGEDRIVAKTVKARDIWKEIIHCAWSIGDPGLMFWDQMVKNHNGEYYANLSTTNPCGEQILPGGSACLLAHINLSALIRDPWTPRATFDTERFKELVKSGVRFLDTVIDLNEGKHALPEQEERVLQDRRMGLGITGLGDMFFKLRLAYGNRASKRLLKDIMFTMAHTAYRESIEMAKETDPFPAFDGKKFIQSDYMKRLIEEVHASGDKDFKKDLLEHGIRNVTLLTIAPVGSGSIVLGNVSSGIEPIFAEKYERDVHFSDGIRTYTEVTPILKQYYEQTGETEPPDYFVTAHELSPDLRIDMQAICQNYIDSGISSTVNLPNNCTEEEVAKIYMNAWQNGLKGITVYREGSREGVIRTKEEDKGGLVKKLFRHSKDLLPSLPNVMLGVRYKINYKPNCKAIVEINGDIINGIPQEVVIQTKAPEDAASAKELGILCTWILRKEGAFGIPSDGLTDELNTIESNVGVLHYDEFEDYGVRINSLAQATAYALDKFRNKQYPTPWKELMPQFGVCKEEKEERSQPPTIMYELCDKCRRKAVIREQGRCPKCLACGHSECG